MRGKILVTGASGSVGAYVAEALAAGGVDVLAGARRQDKVPRGERINFVPFDFNDSSTWNNSLKAVDKVFLMRPPAVSNIKRDLLPFMKCMKQADLKQVIFLSVQGAESNKMVPHHKVEQYCKVLDLPYIFLRPSFFMQNLTTTHLGEIRDEHKLFVPSGKGKTNFIDTRDIAEVAVKLFLEDSPVGQGYTITGEKSYSHGEIAEKLTVGLGHTIEFVNPGPFRFIAYQLRQGRPFGMTLVMLALYSVVKMGKGDVTTDDTFKILKRKPRSLESFIADHREILTT